MLTAAADDAILEALTPPGAMSEEQLSALLAKLKEDAGLREKLQSAEDLDAAEAIAKAAGFSVSKADWLRYHGEETLELSDWELDAVAGGGNKYSNDNIGACDTDPNKKGNKGC